MSEFLPSTPQRRDFSNPLVERNERRVRAWIDELPVHEPIEVITPLLEAVTHLNLEPLPDKERLRLLEHYRSAINRLNDAWEHLQQQLGELPPAQRQETLERFSELLWQLAGGYKIIVKNGYGAGHSPEKDKSLGLALYRTIELLGVVLLDAYRRYAVVPAQTFRELNQCYHFAESHGVHSQAALAEKKRTTAATPELLFKRAMLLSAADPFRLPNGQVARLYQLLSRHGQHCHISRPPWSESSGLFVVDLRDDRAPVPCIKTEPGQLSDVAWILDINPLRDAVQQMINAANDPERALQELDLLRRLLPNLTTPPKRKTPRQKSDKQLRVATGLAAVHHFLTESGQQQVQRSIEHAAYGIEVYDADSESQMSYLLEPWKVVNESPKGYLLTRRHALDEHLQVGELLGLFPLQPSDKRPPEVGIVRWIRRGEEGWVQIGVEVVPGVPAAVYCAPLDPGADSFAEPDAVYLQKVPSLPIPPTLLARRSLYRKDCAITLRIGRQRGKAAIGSLVLETECLVRVTLKPAR